MKVFIKKDIKRYFTVQFLLYVFGRFKIVRFLNKSLKKILKNNHYDQFSIDNYLENNINPELILNNLNIDGYHSGLKLNSNTIDKILFLSNKSTLTSTNNKTFNNFESIDSFNKNNHNPSCLLTLTDPELNEYIDKISSNKTLIEIVKKYLGGISNIETKIQWSPVCNADDAWREQNKQTVTFHYDVHDLNFIYVFFYLTDCDKESGAHELIKGSHNKKKIFKHLIGSAKQTRESLKKDYDEAKFIIIEGKKGHGFIEDTSCFHRALIPTKKPRLTLQFRYS